VTTAWLELTEAAAAVGVLAEAGLYDGPLPDTLACGRDVSEALAASRPPGAPPLPAGLRMVTATLPAGSWELRAGDVPVAGWAPGRWLSLRLGRAEG
jgi:hypothetical protein